jgi:hypothetical protein
MGLFNARILAEAAALVVAIPLEHQPLLTRWAERVRDGSITQENETQLEGDFKSQIVETVLGYASFSSGRPQTVKAKVAMGAGEVDLALGHFAEADSHRIIAPFELKGARTIDLDAPMSGRKITPVQQAWQYAVSTNGVRWVLVSNMIEIRLYAYGEGNQNYERFDLGKIDTLPEYARLVTVLSAERLLGGATEELLARSKVAEKEVTERLYGDYKHLRGVLIEAVDKATGGTDKVKAIGTAQKVLDRVLFVAFAEDTALLPAKLLEKACTYKDPYYPRPVWDNFKALFRAIDEGSEALKVPRYNGGLFRADPAVDALALPDSVCQGFMALGAYDFATEVSVTVLGHIFEQSVTDVERLLARARGHEPEDEKKTGTTGRRKRDGIVYTPDYIARFIVARTLGTHIEAMFQRTMARHAKSGDPADYDGLKFNARKGTSAWTKTELAAWSDYQMQLQLLRVVDPACGSGVFLVAAFDFLRAEYDRVNKKLSDLRGKSGQMDVEDIDREILSTNLYGVDVNEESVEITKLSLWIKTARRGKVLDSLDHTIRMGDSVIEDNAQAYLKHGFDWHRAFPEVFAAGGFDVVLGNPPYVRMELIKAMKPYLEKRYQVASDRADLYAYFFERGIELLKPQGHLGYISSATFFKTGSGSPLRSFILKCATLQTVTDFGDLQVFGGVTTYPAILTMQKAVAPPDHAIAFVKLTTIDKDDFEAAFEKAARPFPQAKLGAGSWELENPDLRALRDKIVAGKRTLKEVYGSPLYGIKTGLNEAFVIDRATRDMLVLADPRSMELLKPFLEGRDLKRWRAEPRDLWIIYIPKNTVDIEHYPAIKAHLLVFKDSLENRATKQEWFELQQAQAAYVPNFEAAKLIYVDMADQCGFSLDRSSSYLANTGYFIPNADETVLALVNSKVSWFVLAGLSAILRGGFIRLFNQNVENLPVPALSDEQATLLRTRAATCGTAAASRLAIQIAVRRRIPDLCPPDRDRALNGKLHDWWELPDFAAFRAAVKAHYKTDIPVKERADWEAFLAPQKAEVDRLSAEIARAEAEIDAIVYRLFDLTPAEIALLEASLR